MMDNGPYNAVNRNIKPLAVKDKLFNATSTGTDSDMEPFDDGEAQRMALSDARVAGTEP